MWQPAGVEEEEQPVPRGSQRAKKPGVALISLRHAENSDEHESSKEGLSLDQAVAQSSLVQVRASKAGQCSHTFQRVKCRVSAQQLLYGACCADAMIVIVTFVLLVVTRAPAAVSGCCLVVASGYPLGDMRGRRPTLNSCPCCCAVRFGSPALPIANKAVKIIAAAFSCQSDII